MLRGEEMTLTLERTVVHILDAQTDPEYKLATAQKLGGYRSVLGVPLMRQGKPIGLIGLHIDIPRGLT